MVRTQKSDPGTLADINTPLTLAISTAVLVVQKLRREVGDGTGDAHVLRATRVMTIPWPLDRSNNHRSNTVSI